MATISGNFLCYNAASSAQNPTKITSIVFTTERYNEDIIRLNATINFTIGPKTGGNFTVGNGPRYLFVKYNGNFYQSNSNLTLNLGPATGTSRFYSTTGTVYITVGKNSGLGNFTFYIQEFLNAPGYGSSKSMIWNGQNASGGAVIMSGNSSWDAYVPPVESPTVSFSSPSNNSIYTSGSVVNFSFRITKGTNSLSSWTLYKGTTLLKTENISSGGTYTCSDIITSDTTYKIQVNDTSGRAGSSSVALKVRGINGKPTNIRVGKSLSNPGFSPLKDTNFKVTWTKPSLGTGNSITSYSVIFNNKEYSFSKDVTNGTISTAGLNLKANQSYSVKVRAYDFSGTSYTESDECKINFISPEFISEPKSDSSVLLEKTKISWSELKTNSLNSDLLTIKYSLGYAIVEEDKIENYNIIATDLTTNSYEWNTAQISTGSLVSLQIIGKVFYNDIPLSTTTKETSNGNYLFKGNLPIKFSEIVFSIPNGDYYGDSSPMNVEYNVNTKEWNLNNSILNFANSLSVQCKMPSSWAESGVYFDGVKIKWKKGLYSGEIIQTSSSDMINPFIFILNEINAPLLFGASGESIRFEIYSLYGTKKADGSPTGIYIYSAEPSLSFDDYPGTNGFIRANLPSIYTNGTSIPTINSTFTRNVNFLENTLGSEDYQLKDLRADNVISDVPVVGFKIYATKDKNDYKNGQIVNVNGYLKQTNGTVTFEDNFYKISESLIPSGNQSAEETTSGFVGFYPQILDDKNYLRQLFFGNISTSLKTLSTNETFYYVITAIDALKQESKGYVLEVKYDFRLAAKFQDSPILINNSFSEVTVNQKTGYLFYGQTEDGADWIIFEWYPAFNQNDYLTNPDNYILHNNKYYLKYNENNLDPNFYTLYKWVDNGKVYSKKLINSDYTTKIETIEGVPVQKYVGKYQMNLKDINVDEFFNLTLMPSYIDSYNEEKMDTPKNNLYPIRGSGSGETINFYLSRLVPASINYDSNERKQGEKFKITLKINNWGFSNDKRILSKTAIMKLNNSSLTNGYIEKNLNINDEYESKLLVFDLAGPEQLGLIFDNMPFSTVTTVKMIATRSLVSNYTYTTGTSTIVTIFNYYLPANFSTLSLRKNKVGINYSDLTNVEEALYVVAKDRIDSGNDVGNVAVYRDTYPHVFSIQGNLDTKMPSFSKETGKALDTLQKASIYMGFYTVNDESKPYRVGSFGIEEGQPYFVYKGKYYNDNTPGQNSYEKDEDGNNIYVKKGYDNKDYFEKISIRNLPVPPGTMVLYPRKNLEEKVNGQTILSQNKLKLINPTWYICDGNQTVTLKTDANLIKAIFSRTEWEGKLETYAFTIPRRKPVGKVSAEPIYNENGTTITGYIEKDIADEYCYIIKGDA